MKLVNTSAIACALAALIATPVLAQGTSSGARPGGTVQSKPMQGGAAGSEDEDLGAQQGAAGEKVGTKSNPSGITIASRSPFFMPSARRWAARFIASVRRRSQLKKSSWPSAFQKV